MNSDWQSIKAKYLLIKQNHPCSDTDGVVTAFRDGEVVLRSERRTEGFTEATEFIGYQGVRKGELVVHSMDAFAGAIGISKSDGRMSPVVHIYRGVDGVDLRYYAYYLKHLSNVGYIQSLSKGIRERSTSFDPAVLKELVLPLPPIVEQSRIADSLDEQIERVDGLITARLLFLSKLEEYSRSYAFNSLISNVKFDAALGFSIESQNQNWEKVPLGVVCTEVKNKNSKLLENNLLSLSYGRIVRKDIESSEGLLPESFDGYNIIDAGDVVLRLTDLQNDQHSLRVGYAEERGIITSAYTTLRSTSLNSAFLSHQLKAFDAAKFFYALGGGLRQSMKFDDLKKLPILVPPLDEQVAFLTKLDANYQSIRSLRDSAQMQIDELKQFRISTISSKVLGKSEENPAWRAI
jgi:type I restriction enzyme S subunit